ncbi:MAG: hypothetical protein QOK47_1061 [Actinomycetota bacterium]|nr:hypothetical protein [Actinomycetota bacterium]
MFQLEMLFELCSKTELKFAVGTLDNVHVSTSFVVDLVGTLYVPACVQVPCVNNTERTDEVGDMRRTLALILAAVIGLITAATPAFACGGLIGPNGAVNLLKTTTFAGYFEGVEHYVTSFEFVGGGAKFGSIVPLPAIPSDVTKGGRWTLQRLVEEVQPPVTQDLFFKDSAVAGSAEMAEVILETRVAALDITVVKGGGDAVGRWAKSEGFNLSPDAPEVLDFYADRSPVFMAVSFNARRAADLGQQQGDGTAVHLTIPTQTPWVPLRILGLGKQPQETVEADVFLLTPDRPRTLPVPVGAGAGKGLILERSEPASDLLLADLRSDRGMSWLPAERMWFSYFRVNTTAGKLTHDLAIDPTGVGAPSPVAAGLVPPLRTDGSSGTELWPWFLAGLFGLTVVGLVNRGLDKGSIPPSDPRNFSSSQPF